MSSANAWETSAVRNFRYKTQQGNVLTRHRIAENNKASVANCWLSRRFYWHEAFDKYRIWASWREARTWTCQAILLQTRENQKWLASSRCPHATRCLFLRPYWPDFGNVSHFMYWLSSALCNSNYWMAQMVSMWSDRKHLRSTITKWEFKTGEELRIYCVARKGILELTILVQKLTIILPSESSYIL